MNSSPSGRGYASVRPPAPARSRAQAPGRVGMRPAPPESARHTLLLDLPIVWRLTIGFLLAALIAALASGLTGLQRAQALSKESSFYEGLLRSNTTLTTDNNALQLMDTKLHETLVDATAPSPSRETLANDQVAMQGLAARYDTNLNDFVHTQLLEQHPDEVALLAEANHSSQLAQQRTLASSALRTWRVYRDAQSQVLQDVASGDVASAAVLERAQGEPTNADALSALRALIQFEERIAASVHDASLVEQQNQLITALVAAALAFLAIGAVGWVISDTLVRRLRQLQRVTQAVEQGQVETRVAVIGRDEIASVSTSVNGMLDTIVGLLDVSRRQRDALVSAAERLFADVRVAGAGDLRLNATVSGDPIGMLGNAFNFTVGRFRRFVLRTQSTVDQLDIATRQVYDRAEVFLTSTQHVVRGTAAGPSGRAPAFLFGQRGQGVESDATSAGLVPQHVVRARELIREMARDGAYQQAHTALDLAEQAYLSAGRLSQQITSAVQQGMLAPGDRFLQAQMAELRTLGDLLTRLGYASQAMQKYSGTQLGELDATLDQIASAAWRLPDLGATPAESAATPIADAQVFELARLSSAFAQDIAALTRQLMQITHEMRDGLAPFRLESGAAGDARLYAPGTGYDEPPALGTFGQGGAYRPEPPQYGAQRPSGPVSNF